MHRVALAPVIVYFAPLSIVTHSKCILSLTLLNSVSTALLLMYAMPVALFRFCTRWGFHINNRPASAPPGLASLFKIFQMNEFKLIEIKFTELHQLTSARIIKFNCQADGRQNLPLHKRTQAERNLHNP